MIHRSPHHAPVIPDVSFVELLLDRIAAHGDAVALIDGATGERTRFAELLAAVRVHGAGLVGASVRPGDVVAIVGENQPRWPIAFLAALAAGATVVPLNPALTEPELTDLLSLSGARAVITNDAAAPAVRSASARIGVELVYELAAFRPVGIPEASGGAAARPVVARGPADVALLPFSSGTTGRPKGVCLTNRNLVAGLVQHEGLQVLAPGDVLLGALPFFHIYGLMLVLAAALSQGATLVTMARFDLPTYLSLVEVHHVTRLHLAPPIVRAFAVAPEVEDHDLRSVRLAQCGAAPLDPELAERASRRVGFPIVQGYGMTEASPGISFTPDDEMATTPRGSVGVLIPGTEARLEARPDEHHDPGHDAIEAGELWIRGPQVMAGYLDAPEASAAAIDDDGWLRTGDVVRIDQHGHLFVIDRVKDLIKYKGFQVAPAELEAVLLDHDAVLDAVVVGIPDDVAGEVPKAFVVPRPEADLDPAVLIAWVATRVAPYKKVRQIEVVEQIPRSPSGKALRRLLRDGR